LSFAKINPPLIREISLPKAVTSFCHDEEAAKTVLDHAFPIEKDVVTKNPILCHCHTLRLLDRYKSQGFQ